MNTTSEYSKIAITVDKIFAKEVLYLLKDIGVEQVSIESGRSILLKNVEGLRKLLATKKATVEDQVQTYRFLVSPEHEADALNLLINRLRLDVPGKGSVVASSINLIGAFENQPVPDLTLEKVTPKVMATNLVGISCITQKGEGNTVAEIGLNTGTAVPTVTFGTGTGLRNRLGLWRILVSAEKEISHLILDQNDAETVMDMMINAGQLDQPGKGFIYSYPITRGALNTKFYDGATSQAASIEQIVSAIDEITGTTEWRKKSLSSAGDQSKKRRFLTGLVNFSMICNEGHAEPLTAVAMAAGAAGATISLLKYMNLLGRESAISPAREISVMTIGEKQVETILAALVDGGIFSKEAAGEVHCSPVLKACTYLGKG